MRRRDLITWLGGAALASPLIAIAHAADKLPRIAALTNVAETRGHAVAEQFLSGMSDLGYFPGRNFDIVYRFAGGDNARLPALAEELVGLKPDVIVTFDPDSARAAHGATPSIPVVSSILTDPVRLGLVASYAHPGGNLTGILAAVEGLSGKQVEIAAELIPAATTFGLLMNPTNSTSGPQRQQVEAAATAKAIKIVVAEARSKPDLDAAFRELTDAGAQAVIGMRDGTFASEGGRIAELATASRLPSVFGMRAQVEAGGLISYGVSLNANHRRAAYFIDKILKGAKPSDLPVEFPTKIELVVNMKTAKALGLTVPQSILLRADDVIE